MVKYDVRKYFFTERIVNLWKSLPSLVVGAPPLNCFKTRLDKFWSKRDVLYDFKHSFWEPELEVIRTEVVSFIMPYIDMGIDSTACTHGTSTIQYDMISLPLSLVVQKS